MRFDSTLYYHVGVDYSWPLIFDEWRETAVLLEELGYGAAWLAEHHFAWDGWYRSGSNPILFGAEVARHTERLRLAQCGVVLPDWHPLRAAEDIAFLDQMTKGRVDFGIAPGINSRACMQFHPAADRRDGGARNRALYEEALDVILAALNEEAFSYRGEFFNLPAPGWQDNSMVRDPRYHNDAGELVKMAIAPRPYQRPIPIFQCSDSAASIERAARRGIGVISSAQSTGKLLENWRLYQRVATQTHGRQYGLGEGLAVMRPTYIAETQKQAEADTEPGFNLLGEWASTSLYSRDYWRRMITDDEFEAGDLDLKFFDFQIKHGLLMVGTPDSVSAELERLRSETNCQHFALFLNFPLLSFEQVTRSLRLFAEEVMPRFADMPGTVAVGVH